jgi:uncharacterized membrane protein
VEFEEFIVFVHIVASIVWVGGAIGFEVIAHRAMQRGNEALLGLAHDAEFIGRIFAASSALVLGFGIWAVADRSYISFGDTWVWLSLVITGVLFLMGPLFFAPQSKRMIALGEDGDWEGLRAGGHRILRVAHLDSIAALVVVYLMVVKPGA